MEVYPLVNVDVTMENHQSFLVGKLSISMASFNSYLSHYQMVYLETLGGSLLQSAVETLGGNCEIKDDAH